MKKERFLLIPARAGVATRICFPLGVLLLFLLSRDAVAQGFANSAWPMFHGNLQHTGRSEGAVVSTVGVPKWTFLDSTKTTISPVIDQNGTIYVGASDSCLYAVNPDGSLRWKYKAYGAVCSSPAVASDGTIYFGCNECCLYALNPNGTRKWVNYFYSDTRSSPVVAPDGTILMGAGDAYLYSFNPNGVRNWQYRTGGGILSSPAMAPDGTIYVSSLDHSLYSLRPNGALIWKFTTGAAIYSSPVVASDGTIFVGSTDNYLYAINPNGILKWKYYAGAKIFSTPAIAADNTIYMLSSSGYLEAILPTGVLKWRYWEGSSLPLDLPPVIGSDGTIYTVGSSGSATAVNPDGTSKWSSRCAARYYAIGTDGTVYASGSSLAAFGGISLTAPRGGESWYTNATGQITWSAVNAASVKLEYSVDNGSTWNLIRDELDASVGTYNWKVPNVTSSGARVKITNNSSHEFTISNTFSILASPAVTSPNGGEAWMAFTAHDITWSWVTVPTLDLEYSTNDGQTWNLIATGVDASSGSYRWTVPPISATGMRVRISNSGYGVSDTSDSTFSIIPRPSIRLLRPDSGDIVNIGSIQTIEWVSSGVSQVKIQYTGDRGASWITIADGVNAGTGSFAWTVAVPPSPCGVVRVSDVSHPEYLGQTGEFKTVEPKLLLLSPNGGESLVAGTKQIIRWISHDIKAVKLYFSPDDGLTWNTIIESTDAEAGSYSWMVPDTVSSKCRIYVCDAPNETVFDANDEVFSILPSLTLTSPNGGESWAAGSSRVIRWISSGVKNIKLQYSADRGANWTTITASTGAAEGSYPWTVPSRPGTEYLVRAADIENPSRSDQSDSLFTVSSDLTVLSPNGGETWVSGTTKTIVWATGSKSTVRIEYTLDGINWRVIAPSVPAASGAYSWSVPLDLITSSGKIRITDTETDYITDESNGGFSIVASAVDIPVGIVLKTPNGGEQWTVGSTRNITWSSWKISSVKLEFSTDNGVSWNTIGIQPGNTEGSYAWTVPCTVSRTCLVRVRDAANASMSDGSDAVFTILPTVAVTSPNGGESLYAETARDITWASSGVSALKIEYSANGIAWVEIASNVDAALGSYSWTIPANLANTTGRVRVTDITDAGVSDTGDGPFTILPRPVVTVSAPNGGEKWISGTTQNITWRSSGVNTVRIEYSTDGGTWTVIADAVDASAGVFAWTVPAVTSDKCLVRVGSTGTPTAVDRSDAAFGILNPALTLTTPNGGEEWAARRTFDIAWESVGIPLVKLEYSTDNGLTWKLIADSVSGTAGKYRWKPPETLSADCLVRVDDRANPGRSDGSDAAFSIVSAPVIQVSAPNGGESWRCDGTRDITWSVERIDSLRVEYTLDGGQTWRKLARSIPAASGSFPWKLPGEPSTQCLVRLTDASDSTFADTSDSSFSILLYNLNAGFAVDTDLETVGGQGADSIENIGGGKLIGFALYAREWENAKGITVSFSWDPARVEYRASLSSTDISDDERNLNGISFTPGAETNILGRPLIGAGEVSRPGCYTKSFAQAGSSPAAAGEGLICLAVFRTTASFTVEDTLAIRAVVKMVDERGMERDLGTQFFTIRRGLLPPSNPVVSDVPGDQGHRLRLTWGVSPSGQTGLVAGYRIFRSRANVFASPQPLTRFSTLDSLLFYEQRYPVLIDSVSAEKTEFIDPFVPLNGVQYYYWVQAFGASGASKPVISAVATPVEETARNPLAFRLGAAHPNPFNPGTTITYVIPEESAVVLEVYNISGQKVATLENGRKRAGEHAVAWDARELPSGVYFYTLRAGQFRGTGKALLMK